VTDLALSTDELRVVLRPQKGADIVSIEHRPTATGMLFTAPWSGAPTEARHAPDSFSAWVRAYSGGWQVLLPNAGGACVERGVEWGFHGEAAMVPWTVEDRTATGARLRVALLTAPIEIERELELDAGRLRIRESLTNVGADPVEVMWGHHPTFGAPFLDGSCTIELDAEKFIADDQGPGTVFAPAASGAWPAVTGNAGGVCDLSLVPGAGEPRAVFGYLSGFRTPEYTITNHRLGLSATLRWDGETFPYAWFWQEIHATRDFPWFGRAYATAIEPQTTIPGQGIAVARQRGSRLLTLVPGQPRETVLQLEVRT
jgi:galactose mutarotase-like enzyme